MDRLTIRVPAVRGLDPNALARHVRGQLEAELARSASPASGRADRVAARLRLPAGGVGEVELARRISAAVARQLER